MTDHQFPTSCGERLQPLPIVPFVSDSALSAIWGDPKAHRFLQIVSASLTRSGPLRTCPSRICGRRSACPSGVQRPFPRAGPHAGKLGIRCKQVPGICPSRSPAGRRPVHPMRTRKSCRHSCERAVHLSLSPSQTRGIISQNANAAARSSSAAQAIFTAKPLFRAAAPMPNG